MYLVTNVEGFVGTFVIWIFQDWTKNILNFLKMIGMPNWREKGLYNIDTSIYYAVTDLRDLMMSACVSRAGPEFGSRPEHVNVYFVFQCFVRFHDISDTEKSTRKLSLKDSIDSNLGTYAGIWLFEVLEYL